MVQLSLNNTGYDQELRKLVIWLFLDHTTWNYSTVHLKDFIIVQPDAWKSKTKLTMKRFLVKIKNISPLEQNLKLNQAD